MQLFVPLSWPALGGCLRQEGAFLHQQSAEAKLVQWWIMKLHKSVARDAYVQLHVDFPICSGIVGRCSLNDDQVGVQRILPLDYSFFFFLLHSRASDQALSVIEV